MIVITLAGESSRFFSKGYNIVKYKLEYNERSIIYNILDFIPREEKLLIIANKKFNDVVFLNDLLIQLNFSNFRVCEIDSTRGQFESVLLGLSLVEGFWDKEEYLTIYNGDTIRKSKNWSFDDCDGYIEVFEDNGIHWSFVDTLGKVNLVTEKNKISNFCSSGLYYFKEISFFLKYVDEYLSSIDKEFYVAPYYNILIKRKLSIKSGLINSGDLIFCGTPEEYIVSLNKISKL